MAQEAQTQPAGAPGPDALRPSAPRLLVKAARADSWSEGQTNIILLRGGVELQAGEATLRAPEAVIWLEKLPGEARSRADVVLVGTAEENAVIQTPEARQFGERLAANVIVDGVRIDVPQREARDLSASELYRAAALLRPAPATQPAPEGPVPPGGTTRPTIIAPPTTRRVAPVQLIAKELRTTPTDDETLAVLATGGVFLMQRSDEGDLIELAADRAVVFTSLKRLDEAGGLDPAALREAITGVYLEGDVRIVYTPGRRGRRDQKQGFAALEQRLEARQVFYDFTTDRAVLTKAVLHTSEPEHGQPLTVRADVIRQLARGNYNAQSAEISTSRMAVPDYSLNASRVFIRTRRDRAVFGADNVSARLFEVPVLWFPAIRGATLDNRLPLRQVSVGQSSVFGNEIQTTWGLFETFNATPPQTLDATYSLGYLSDRGVSAGLNADYYGDLFLFGNRPETFSGDLRGFLVNDNGVDKLGGKRLPIPQDELRGRVYWEHEQYLPGGWSALARLGYVSDPGFLEQWQRRQFWDGEPHDMFFNVERARGNELLGLQIIYDINDFATTADTFQEGADVERLPEGQYARFGQRLGLLTLTSRNRIAALQFNNYGSDPAAELGLVDRPASTALDESFTGIPAHGYTGTPESITARADFRQEVSLPVQASGLSLTPFAVGRLTAYGDQVNGEETGRVLGGVGVRLGTALVRTDDSIYSQIFDLDRMRHVVEPSITGFASWQSQDASDFFIFDQGIDDITDVTAVQVALRQRWQTKRGAPGRRRSVDFFTWNIEANLFDTGRDEVIVPTGAGLASAAGFRGLFFASEPEASLARDGINTDAQWRISDTTALVGDAAYSLESDDLVTVAAGMTVTRDDRLSYSIGGRYVEPLDLTLAVGSINYNLSQRYSIAAAASYDVDVNDVRNTTVLITRRFDRFFVNVGLYLDRIDDDSGIRFMVAPVGFREFALSSNQLDRTR